MDTSEPLSRPELLRRLLASIEAAALDHPVRVAIDGPDAAGKTTLADELAVVMHEAGRHVIRASIDGFHRPRADRYARGPDSPVGYYRDSFDYEAIRSRLLEPLGPRGTREYRLASFDFRTDQPVDLIPAVAPQSAVLLFDGVFLLRPELRGVWDLRVFVSAAFEEILRRVRVRDAAMFGSAAEVERRYRVRYIPGQRIYYAEASPDRIADVVIFNDDPKAPRLRVR